MKQFVVSIFIGFAITAGAQQPQLDWGDQGNGTYKNPVLNADYSDPDVIRVGRKYYMVASDFHWTGMQVLESEDLVNWQLVSQVYRRFDYPGWDSNAHYAGGSWAPSIRYHDGLFWVYFCTPDEGLFMTTAENPRGPWQPLHCVRQVAKWEDPCPFWDEDDDLQSAGGQAYLGRSRHGAGPIIVHKLSADGRQLLDDGVTVYTGPVAEGTKFLKRNGWYYLIIPEGGVGTGWQTVLRSRNIYGPYEKKVVLEQGSTDVNGPHQGALVDTPDGQWWFLHFQETTPNGRVVHLQPVRWKDDWPLMGVDIDGNGIGEPVRVWTNPYPNSKPALPATSDDFNDRLLGLQWQWCHNPVDDHWSLTERKGYLTLHALPADSLKQCRSLLTQKVMGYQGEATLLLEANQTTGLRAGLALTGKAFHAIGLSDEGVYTESAGRYTLLRRCKVKRLWLRVVIDSRHNRHQLFYSLDGKRYEAAGSPFTLRPGYWKGIRVGLFAYTVSDSNATAYFDSFVYHVKE